MKKTLRLFISSPGDVGREREATRRVIERLQSEFAEHVALDPYFWEWEPVDFGQDYQSQIPSTADFDIVICLLWSKLGSRLGEQHKLPPDYQDTASSGTQYELMQALHGKQQHPEKLPDLLVWVNKSPPPPASSPPLSRKDEDELIRQRRALQDFLATITRDTRTGIFTAAVNRYEVPSEDLGSYQYLDEFEDMMDKKLRKLIEKHIGERTVKPKPQWQGSPFRDLDVFEFEHAPIFFGRSRAIGEVVRLLQSTLSKPQPCHFALILGASGSGKSSLARAGVLPLLTRPGVIEGIGLWRCAIVRPSDDSGDLFQALASALLREGVQGAGLSKSREPQHLESAAPCQPPALPELADPESTDPQTSLAAELRAHPQTVAIRVKDQLSAVAKAHQTQQRHALEAQIASLTKEGRQADAALKQQALQNLQEPKARLVLLLDQMEELFTLNYAPEQLRAFLETIAVLARSGRVFVIGTLRSDFYPRYQEQPTLVALARDGARFDLLPPTPDEISQIIRRPASLAALQFEPHPTTAEHTLADTLRDEALADTEALPLLEHVLNRLYQAQLPRADGRLTFADYEDICGVDVDPKTHVKTSRGVGGALGKHAEDIFTGHNRQPTDPPPPWTEETFRAVFRCLVTFGKGEGDTDVPNRRAFTYQDLIQSDPAAQALVDTFIHERLLIADTDAQSRPIVRLSHEALLTRWPRLANWLQTAPVRDLMSQRRRLESSLRQWQEQNRTPDCFLQPGFELEEGKQLLEKHEGALKPEEREFIRASVAHHSERERVAARHRRIVITVLSGLTCAALVAGWYAWSQAIEAQKQRAVAQTQTGRAQAALAESNLQLERSQVEESRAWLERGRSALSRGDHLKALVLAGRAVGFDGYGRKAGDTQFAKRFPPLLCSAMTDSANEIVRKEDVSKVTEFTDRIRPTHLPIWSGSMDGMISCIAFSPDGCCVASASWDKTISLWDAATGKKLASFQDKSQSEVTGVAFSPDGTHLVATSRAGTIKVWDVVGKKQLPRFPNDGGSVNCVAFSPDGSLLLTGSSDLSSGASDCNLKLWDFSTHTLIASLAGHTASITSVSFSPDGTKFVSVCDHGEVIVWDVRKRAMVSNYSGELIESALGVVYTNDGKRVIYGREKEVWIHDASTSKQTIPPLTGHTDTVYSVDVDPIGARIASASWDQSIKFWNVETGKLEGTLSTQGGVTSIAFSPDGTRLASGSSANQITIWDVATSGHLNGLEGVFNWYEEAISPDGSLVATGDDYVRFWDAGTCRELATCMDFRDFGRSTNNLAFSPDGAWLACRYGENEIEIWSTFTGENKMLLFGSADLDKCKNWFEPSRRSAFKPEPKPILDLAGRLSNGLLDLSNYEVRFPEIEQSSRTFHVWRDALAKLADSKLKPERRAELRMELCTKSSQFRAATALWQRLLQGEWPGFEHATVPKDQAPATIPDGSPIRRLYLLALSDATKHPQIHGHPTIGQTAAQIAPVLTKEMMATPTISLAMMSLMQTLAKDDSPDMSAPRAALLKRLEEVATKEWLAVLRESAAKK